MTLDFEARQFTSPLFKRTTTETIDVFTLDRSQSVIGALQSCLAQPQQSTCATLDGLQRYARHLDAEATALLSVWSAGD